METTELGIHSDIRNDEILPWVTTYTAPESIVVNATRRTEKCGAPDLTHA